MDETNTPRLENAMIGTRITENIGDHYILNSLDSFFLVLRNQNTFPGCQTTGFENNRVTTRLYIRYGIFNLTRRERPELGSWYFMPGHEFFGEDL